MAQSSYKKLIIPLVALVVVVGAAAYYLQGQPAGADPKGNAPAQAAPPQKMPVTAILIEKRDVQLWNNYSARIEAVDFVEIRPQVSGRITDIQFEDGQIVEKGDVIYVIDPRPFQAALKQAQALLAGTQNRLSLAKKELARAQELIKTDTIPKSLYDERRNTVNVAVSEVKAAEAQLDRARIDIDYAYVKAPISGRISRAEIKLGNLVSSGANAPILTSIVSDEGVFADFEVDEQTYLKHIRSVVRDSQDEKNVPVRLLLNGESQNYNGFIHSFDNRIDPNSGTIRARAFFENEDGALLPGMFASVQMGSPSTQERILVPERAIGTDQNRKFVYVVNDQDIIEYREVQIGQSTNGNRIINQGLNEGDKVVTEGIIRIRPDMPVAPEIQLTTID